MRVYTKKTDTEETKMLCERPRFLRDLGIADNIADRFTDKFPTMRITQKTVNALLRVINMPDEVSRPADISVLEQILSELIDGDATSEATRLIETFGSMLGVVAAIENNDARLWLTAGVAMRINLLCSLYLCKVRPVTVSTRAQAELYLGELIECDEDKTTALGLDDDLAVITATSVGSNNILDDAADKLYTLNAKYVILSRKTPTLDDRFFNLSESVNKLSSALKQKDIALADFLIFTPQGNAHLINAKSAPRFEFTPFDLPYRF